MGIKEGKTSKIPMKKSESKERSKKNFKEHSSEVEKFLPSKTIPKINSGTKKEERKSFLTRVFNLNFHKTQQTKKDSV